MPKDLTPADMTAQLIANLPPSSAIPAEHIALADRVRDLVEAALMTATDPAELASVADEVTALTERLNAVRRPEAIYLVVRPDGTPDNVSQAGSGQINPQAPRLKFIPPAEGDHCRATVTLTAAHGGPPLRAHGGIVALLLDQVVGFASWHAGLPGMTAQLNVRLRKATPYGVPLDLRARMVRSEGRKRFVTGEVYADGEITADAEAVLVTLTGSIADLD